MIGLEITRNGKKAIIAGGQNVISLSAVVAVFGRLGDLAQSEAEPFGNLTVFGVSDKQEGNKQEMITWNQKKHFSLGDEILIRFVEIDSPSKPSEIQEVTINDDPE
jgi:hypothetical protein